MRCRARESCRRNEIAAKKAGQHAAAGSWALLAFALAPLLGGKTHAGRSHRGSCWSAHPFGRRFVDDILEQAMRRSDVQSVPPPLPPPTP